MEGCVGRYDSFGLVLGLLVSTTIHVPHVRTPLVRTLILAPWHSILFLLVLLRISDCDDPVPVRWHCLLGVERIQHDSVIFSFETLELLLSDLRLMDVIIEGILLDRDLD